jgi:hypothetical protein
LDWCAIYEEQWRLVQQSSKPGKQPHRFRYDLFKGKLGGRRGLLIKDFLAPQFVGIQWDLRPWLRDHAQPCVPLVDVHPGVHSEWDLDRIRKDAFQMGYPDRDIISDCCDVGFRSHSEQDGSNVVYLCPNYAAFWLHHSFTQEKAAEDRVGFAKPRLEGSYKEAPPMLPCRIHPRGVAVVFVQGETDPATGKPKVLKKRITVDPMAPRAPPGAMWEPGEDISWNAGVDISDPSTYPQIQYGSVDRYARGVAVLASAELPLGQAKWDVRGYFRALTRNSREVPYALQWVDGVFGIQEDWSLQFGETPNPGISQRMSSFFRWRIYQEVEREQRRWRAEGLVPPPLRAQLTAWEQARRDSQPADDAAWLEAETQRQLVALRAADEAMQDLVEFRVDEATLQRRASTAAAQALKDRPPCDLWAFGDVFIDDHYWSAFDFFVSAVVTIVEDVCAGYGVELADGRVCPITGVTLKNKSEVCRNDTPMEILGIVITPRTSDGGAGSRRLTPERAQAYAAAGEAVVGKPSAPRLFIQSWLGKLCFAGTALPRIKALLYGLLGSLKQHWAGYDHVTLGPLAWAAIADACAALRANDGAALWPMRAPLGSHGRRVVWTGSDAARAPDAPPSEYVGWGFWIFAEGTDTVLICAGRWQPRHQELCITTLELAVENAALQEAQELARGLWGGLAHTGASNVDIVQLGDNHGARDVAMGVRAASPALRAMLRHRSDVASQLHGGRVANLWSHREMLDEPDLLSKGKMAEAIAQLHVRFGRRVRIVRVPTPTCLHPALDASISALHIFGS